MPVFTFQFQTLYSCCKDESADLSWLNNLMRYRLRTSTKTKAYWSLKQVGWYEISTVKRAYHIRYDNFNLFEEIVPPLLQLSRSLNKRSIVQKESNEHYTARRNWSLQYNTELSGVVFVFIFIKKIETT